MSNNNQFWNDLAGKVIVITGGTSGIGLGVASVFVAKGARVVITGRRAELGEEIAKKLGVTFIKADTAVEADVAAVFERVKSTFGHVDLVFANAGIALFGDTLAGFNVDGLQRMIDVNVKGTIYTFKAALPLLVSNGLLLANSSAVSTMAVPAFNGYAVSKVAIDQFVRSAGDELKATGQRLYTINPFVFASEMSDKLGDNKALAAQMNPSGVLGEPASIAKLIEDLALGRATYPTGSNIAIDGDGSHFLTSEVVPRLLSKATQVKH